MPRVVSSIDREPDVSDQATGEHDAYVQIFAQVAKAMTGGKIAPGERRLCKVCKEAISSARLKALPPAIRCKECEEMDEKVHPKIPSRHKIFLRP